MKLRVLLAATTILAAACGGDSPTGSSGPVTVHARILSGPSGGASSLDRLATGPSRVIVVGNGPQAGNWLLSPDKLALTVTQLSLTQNGASVNAANVSCAATVERAEPSLTQLAACDFTVSPGTYDGVDVGVSSTYGVTFSDAANGFYSTSTGLVTSAPPGGVQPYSVTLTSSGGSEGHFNNTLPFVSPLTISDTSNLTINIVINASQFFHANVDQSGVVSLGWPGTTYTDPFRPDIVAAVGGSIAKVEMYSLASVGTWGSYCASQCLSGSWPTGITSVAVYYTSPTTPAAVSTQLNGTPANCGPIGVGYVSDRRGYLGLDANGNLGWAVPTTSAWSAYAAQFRLATVTTVGGGTTLYCQNISADPKPAGGSFASGAPNIASGGNSQGTFVLVSK